MEIDLVFSALNDDGLNDIDGSICCQSGLCVVIAVSTKHILVKVSHRDTKPNTYSFAWSSDNFNRGPIAPIEGTFCKFIYGDEVCSYEQLLRISYCSSNKLLACISLDKNIYLIPLYPLIAVAKPYRDRTKPVKLMDLINDSDGSNSSIRQSQLEITLINLPKLLENSDEEPVDACWLTDNILLVTLRSGILAGISIKEESILYKTPVPLHGYRTTHTTFIENGGTDGIFISVPFSWY